eukprot:gene14464-8011_t
MSLVEATQDDILSSMDALNVSAVVTAQPRTFQADEASPLHERIVARHAAMTSAKTNAAIVPGVQVESERRKVVRFDEKRNTIHTLPHPFDPCVATNMEEGCSATSSSSMRTSKVTLLSTAHGKARRELRDISKTDLRNAVKHGRREPGYPRRSTGEPTWKYTFANTVYITDATSRNEITSYKESIAIEKAVITSKDAARHRRAKAQLASNPSLCATHTILVVDQSASMKKCDVSGFRTRSNAAYGTLALDYLAHQLHDTDTGCEFDFVSVVEFNVDSIHVLQREPLDWILFNYFVDRQEIAMPADHGLYAVGLRAIEDIVNGDRHEFGASFAPEYVVIFLSDGAPSDCGPTGAAEEALTKIAAPFTRMLLRLNLKEQITFNAVGLGAPAKDFVVLKGLVDVSKSVGMTNAKGRFSHSNASCGSLSTVMTQLSSMLTAIRTTTMTVTEDSTPKLPRDLDIRPRRFATKNFHDHEIWANATNISRYLLEKKGNQFNWRAPRYVFTQKDHAVGMKILQHPFDEGAERYVFLIQEFDTDDNPVGRIRVAKESRYQSIRDQSREFHRVFCQTQATAADLANQFNNAVKRCRGLKPLDPLARTPRLLYLSCWVLRFRKDGSSAECAVLVEEDLQNRGKYVKYTTNNGQIKSSGGPTMSLMFKSSTVFYSDFLHAFSHWTWFHHKKLVCDLQGALDQEGQTPTFVLTDPAICTTDEQTKSLYGDTNTHGKGVRNFMKTHKCSAVCTALGLPPTCNSE